MHPMQLHIMSDSLYEKIRSINIDEILDEAMMGSAALSFRQPGWMGKKNELENELEDEVQEEDLIEQLVKQELAKIR